MLVAPGAIKGSRPRRVAAKSNDSKASDGMRSYIGLAASLAVCALLVGCSNPEKTKKEHFDNAERFMTAGKVQEAIVEYRNALRDDPKYGEARFKLAEAYKSVGNNNQAYREYVRAADEMPLNNEAQLMAARYLVVEGKFDEARTRVQTVIDRDPTNSQAQLVMGSALVGLKDLDGAVDEIQEAIKLDPNQVAAYTSLAAVKLAQGDREQAKQAFEKAVQVDPKSVPARLSLAYYQWGVGDVAAAEESLKTANSIDPKNGLANRTLAVFYVATKRPAMAEQYLKASAEGGSPSAVLQLADYYVAFRRFDDATATLAQLTKNPTAAGTAQVRMAQIAYAKNDKARAHSLLDDVLTREPNNISALLNKAQWLLNEKKPQDALVSAQAATKASPRSAEAHFTLATIQSQLQMRKEAMLEYGEVLRLNPRASRAQVQLSRLSLVDGSSDKAVTFAEDALRIAPTDPEARANLVRGLIGRKDFARAEQELAPLLKQYPQIGTVHAMQGALKMNQKDFAGARAAYTKAVELMPKSTEALAGLVGLDLVQNKPQDARARVEARLAGDPNNVELLMLSAQVAAAGRDFPKAEATLRKAIQSDTTYSRAYGLLASVLFASGKLDAARAEFDQIAQKDPRNIAARTMAAMIVDSQGKKDDAKKRYQEIVDIAPSATVAANNLAWLWANDGEKLDDALRLAQSAAARAPESAEIQDTIGWIYYKKELPALAVTAFERSIGKSPDNASYHYHLALALAKAGDPQRAREAAQQAVKLKPDYADAQKLLAQTKG